MKYEWDILEVCILKNFQIHQMEKLLIVLGAAAIGTASITFWMRDDLTPWNLDATFTVSYTTMSDSKFLIIQEFDNRKDEMIYSFLFLDICQTIQKTYKLPLKLVARPCQQSLSNSNASQCKVTLGANKPVADLNRIFPGKNI